MIVVLYQDSGAASNSFIMDSPCLCKITVCLQSYFRVSAGLKFTSDILSKQLQFCSVIWKFFRTFFNTNFYHHKRKLPSALLKLRPGVVLLPFRMASAV